MFKLRFDKGHIRNKFRYEKNYTPMGDLYGHVKDEHRGSRIYATNWIWQTPLFTVRLRMTPATW